MEVKTEKWVIQQNLLSMIASYTTCCFELYYKSRERFSRRKSLYWNSCEHKRNKLEYESNEWKNHNLVEMLSRRFNVEEVYLLFERQTTRKTKQIDFIYQLKNGTMSRRMYVCMIENVIKFVIFVFSSFESIFCQMLRARTYSNIISYSPPREKDMEKCTKEKQSWKSSFLLLHSQIWCYPFKYPSAIFILGFECLLNFRAINIRSLACSWKTLDKCNFTLGVKWIGFVQQKLQV